MAASDLVGRRFMLAGKRIWHRAIRNTRTHVCPTQKTCPSSPVSLAERRAAAGMGGQRDNSHGNYLFSIDFGKAKFDEKAQLIFPAQSDILHKLYQYCIE